MKLLKFTLLVLLALAGSVQISQAQLCPPANSLADSVWTVPICGKPGDTVDVPVYLANSKTLAGFQFYFEFDSSIVKPVVDYIDIVNCDTLGLCDTIYNYFHTRTSRMNPDQSKWTVQLVNDVDYRFPDNPGFDRIKMFGIGAIPGLGEPVNIGVDSGSGPIMTVPFEVLATAPDGAAANFRVYVEPITLDGIIVVGCQYSKYSDSTGNIDVALTTPPRGRVNVDVNCVEVTKPTVVSFTSDATTITQGGSTTLRWQVSADADSVIVVTGAVRTKYPVSQTSLVVAPTITTAYTIVAENQGVESDPSATIVITVTTPGSNNAPVVSLNPTSTFYEIEQGQTVSFDVSANDSDGDDLTLTANSLPGNATFSPTNPVLGNTSVTGTFSFTPDINQSGSFTVSFTASDGNGGNTSRSVNIQVNELQFDVLFSTSSEGESPVGGLGGADAIYFPINMVTSQTVYGIQFDMFYDDANFVLDSFVTTGRTANYTIYDDIGLVPGKVRVVAFGLANEPIQTVADTTAVLYAVMSIKDAAVPGDYPIVLDSGYESVSPDPNIGSLPLVTTGGIIQVDRPGDVNLDKLINVADLVNIVAEIIDNYDLNPRQFATADVITDLSINVFDLVGVVNMIYGLPPQPSGDQGDLPQFATLTLEYNDIFPGNTEYLVVKSELPTEVAGVELDITYHPGYMKVGRPELTDDIGDLALAYKDDGHGNLKVLMHYKSPVADQIEAGEPRLIYIPVQGLGYVAPGDESKVRVSSAHLSTANATSVPLVGPGGPNIPNGFSLHQNYPNPFNPNTTIQFELGSFGENATEHVQLEIFNILGRHVKTLVDERMLPGSYQVEWNGTTSSGSPVASGIYLYRLVAGESSETRKMVLLK
jgi:hypothetical protein